jgi:hypothetical protein
MVARVRFIVAKLIQLMNFVRQFFLDLNFNRFCISFEKSCDLALLPSWPPTLGCEYPNEARKYIDLMGAGLQRHLPTCRLQNELLTLSVGRTFKSEHQTQPNTLTVPILADINLTGKKVKISRGSFSEGRKRPFCPPVRARGKPVRHIWWRR